MNLSPSEALCAYSATAEVVRRYRLGGRRIPAGIVQLYARLEMEVATAATSTGDESVDLIGATEAARLLHCTPRHIRRRAQALGGVRVGHEWIFSRSALTEFARSEKNSARPHLENVRKRTDF